MNGPETYHRNRPESVSVHCRSCGRFLQKWCRVRDGQGTAALWPLKTAKGVQMMNAMQAEAMADDGGLIERSRLRHDCRTAGRALVSTVLSASRLSAALDEGCRRVDW